MKWFPYTSRIWWLGILAFSIWLVLSEAKKKEIRDTLSLYTYNNNYTRRCRLFIFKMQNDCFFPLIIKNEEEYLGILYFFSLFSFIIIYKTWKKEMQLYSRWKIHLYVCVYWRIIKLYIMTFLKMPLISRLNNGNSKFFFMNVVQLRIKVFSYKKIVLY